MKSSKRFTAIFLIISIASLLALSGCDNIGIFATIAVSSYIDEGLLPEGTSPSKVLHVDNGTLDNYDFFSSGPRLWARDISGGRGSVTATTAWRSVSLVDDNGVTWHAIQSIAAANDGIVLTLAREPGSVDIETGLFYFTTYDSSTRTVNLTGVTDAVWTGIDDVSYQVTRAFVPDATDINNTTYLNVQNYSGSFADSDTVFDGSSLYVLDPFNDILPAAQGGDWATNLMDTERMITSAAYSGSEHVFTISNQLGLTTGDGLIVNDAGTDITPAIMDVPVSGVTWLDDVGAFVVGAQALSDADGTLSDDVYPVYGGNAAADSWSTISGANNTFRVHSFLDVSTTNAGDDDFIILGGTASFASDEGIGYVEIHTDGTNTFGNWSIIEANGSFTFAYANNYSVSDLVNASIDGMAIYNDYVYLSARGLGVWRAYADEETPSWSQE